ncbi:unnamed protein product [Heterosigma akashiwo]
MQASMASPNLLRLFMGLLFLMLVTILFADGFALRTSSGNAGVLKRKQQPVYEKAKMVPAMSFVSISEKDRVLKDLEPKALWGYFEDLSQIPRPSKHEEKVLQYLKDFAESHGLLWAQDKIGNLVIKRQGINGGENANPVIIQNHVDMVTEQNAGTAHDFRRDPLRLAVERRPSPSGLEEEWVTALGTTLGADNGIGAAAALALLALGEEEGRPLPPLEALFTGDEETGLTGAYALDPGALGLRGRTLLNLDTEEWGALYVGCAGGGESCITVPPGEREPLEEDELIFELRVDGLMGGHSGINIHEGRANAIRILTGVLDGVSEEGYTCAWRPWAAATSTTPSPRGLGQGRLLEDEVQEVAAVVRQASKRALKAHRVETAGRVTLLPLEGAREEEGGALTVEETDLLVALLNDLPLGVLAMSKDLEGLVETSNNLASVKPSPKVAGAWRCCAPRGPSDPHAAGGRACTHPPPWASSAAPARWPSRGRTPGGGPTWAARCWAWRGSARPSCWAAARRSWPSTPASSAASSGRSCRGWTWCRWARRSRGRTPRTRPWPWPPWGPSGTWCWPSSPAWPWPPPHPVLLLLLPRPPRGASDHPAAGPRPRRKQSGC